MPGLSYYSPSGQSIQAPDIQPFALASSITSYSGDALVRTVIGGNIVVRPLTQADITALYLTGGNVCGVLGYNPNPFVTDVNGIASSSPSSPGVLGNVSARFSLPTIDYAQSDTVTGRSMAAVPVFSSRMYIGGSLWENTTITENLKGIAVGLLLSTVGGVPYYYWSSAAATKIGVVKMVSTQDALFNKAVVANVQDTTNSPRCPIGVELLSTFCQENLQFSYAG